MTSVLLFPAQNQLKYSGNSENCFPLSDLEHNTCSRIEPHEKREIGYERSFFADNGSSVGVLPDPDECHDGTLEHFEKFKVKVYIGVKFEIYANRVKTCTNIFLVSHRFRKYILLPTSIVSVLSY